ncbi:hypothetical protein Tco_0217281 [Tanacetum coccineum]
MVAYLEKSTENVDFDEIVDFLNASPNRYALTIIFNDEYDTPSHTKKVFTNMRRQGKDFPGTVTPLFATMLIQPQADVGEADETVCEERGDSVERAATTAASLDAEQDSVRIESSTKKSLGDQEDASKQGRNEDQDEDISWFQEDAETQGRYGHDIGITTAEPVTTASVPVTTASPTRPVDDSITDDITLAETLMKIKSSASRPQNYCLL